ncbi:MAG: TIGR02391 family protein [Dechloromonas sp.]|nr:TIGR02391 family protein [Dechloromonas sp.]
MEPPSHSSPTRLTSDGAELAQTAFALPKDGSAPPLAINDIKNDTDRGEQRGFSNLLAGFFGTVRNPLAHNPKAKWPIGE